MMLTGRHQIAGQFAAKAAQTQKQFESAFLQFASEYHQLQKQLDTLTPDFYC